MPILRCLCLTAFAATPLWAAPPTLESASVFPSTKLSPDEEHKRETLTRYGLGLLRSRNEEPTKAIVLLQKAVEGDPSAAAPQRELAKLYAELGRDPAAIRAAEAVLKVDPTDGETARLLGSLYSGARLHADAVRAYKLAAKSASFPDPVTRLTLLKELARAADAAKDSASAEQARRDALKAIEQSRAKLLKPELFSPQELERERGKLYEGIGNALAASKDFTGASAAFEAAADIFADRKGANDPSGVARLHWNRSGSLQLAGEPAKALVELEKCLAKQPTGFAPYERFVQLYTALKKTDELPEQLERLAEANPKNRAPVWLGAAATLEKRPANGNPAFRKLLATGTTAEEYRTLARAHREANRPQELFEFLDKLFRAARPESYESEDPPKIEPPARPAEAVERARLLSAAVKDLRPEFTARLIEQFSNEVRLGTWSGSPDTLELLSELSTRDKLARPFTDALGKLARQKSNVQTTGVLLRQLTNQRRWRELATAAEELKEVRKAKGVFIYYSIGANVALAYAELNQERKALEALVQAGTGYYADGIRIQVLLKLEKPTEALAHCEKVLAKERPMGDDYRRMKLAQSGALDALKRFAEAEAILRELLDNDPDDAMLLNNLGYHLADENRKLPEAEKLIRRAIELDKFARIKNGDPEAESGGYADSLGWFLFRRGKLKEAREQLEFAAKSGEESPSPVVWDHLGDVAFRQGDTKRALEAWTKAAELYRDCHLGRQDGRLEEAERKVKLAR